MKILSIKNKKDGKRQSHLSWLYDLWLILYRKLTVNIYTSKDTQSEMLNYWQLDNWYISCGLVLSYLVCRPNVYSIHTVLNKYGQQISILQCLITASNVLYLPVN